ncbi:GtrA family protein [Cellulosimicrobium cellulans]|uniref:GtrA family protein n=1 Tax=Cellulosimicrobium cellulans TaxID=1710 RepID=UPI0030B912A0|nr:putative flippase GtrA [Cellulosimicrobium cellulans]
MTSDLDRRAEADTAALPRRERVLARVRELAKFGSVGAVAYVVDLGLFNLLSFGPGELLGHKPLTAKIVSVTVATLVAWVGNRYWTFSARRTQARGRELAAFVVVNVGGMLIAVGCLAISTYALGLTSPLAKNVSANVVGLALGTAFRYVAYRRLVFTGDRAEDAPAAPQDVAAR